MLNDPPVPHRRSGGVTPVRSDVYPADVAFSFATNPYSRARAIVTADTVMVLVENGTPSGAGVLYEGRLEDVNLVNRTHLVAVTADGEVTITRQAGCGCGSRLRSYRPFGRAVRMAKAPA
jgi:hypothetical protein